MFGRLKEIIDNTKKLTVNKVAFFVFRDKTVQKIVIDLNRIDQLFYEGVKSDGSTLPLYRGVYNQVYTFEGNTRTKAQGEPYALYDTGEFYRSFKLIQQKDGFIITANDEKENGTLQEMYGNNVPILGLTEESIAKLTEEIKPYLVKTIREEILRKH